ncbi:MAG TPA: histidine kinase [Thermoanaerobaculia bacterium]|jgi:two-component system sensor histidine kinase KdpD|nr:histidine kinase [Thermoanaerobaculia bacterium]
MPQEDSRRTSPDVFLRLLEKARRGKLKIYIGHAAGVGKTYQMLEDAHALKKQGVDVVVGLVETHGRAETAERTVGLEFVPRRTLEYKGKQLEEMDLPAILRRKPEVVIVDELAHTNVPTAENVKRYQDVEELLAAGISVMTAVNIQHFESVQDIVSRVTGVDVQERVPDRLLRQADALINVDLPSEELRERLRAGKIYPSERIGPALENFFTEDNLASLRELAMRQIADRLEAERRGPHATAATEPVGTKAMVAMSSNPETTRLLLRRASALAGKLNTNWFAVYVRTPKDSPQRMSAREHRLLSENVTLAMELGAKVVWLSGEHVARELLLFAREHRITLAIFGKSRRSPWLAAFRPSPIDVFANAGTGIDVYEIETDSRSDAN